MKYAKVANLVRSVNAGQGADWLMSAIVPQLVSLLTKAC
jgi:hypothetical protein